MTVGVKLDSRTRMRLKKLAEAKQRSAHWLMKEAIERYLHDEERYEQERVEDEARWQEYLDTGAAMDHENAMTWLDELAERAARKTSTE